ncbi:putative sugar nucleotidyl transferase [Planctomicrobium piriforme]|uniref:UDP-N-acetylglucosamine diphosphorylase/glucosamine-1-phosphate N-acetyltransferase n=1 Tax=Planctomicrobium piriforme TaxID=1576369 RepID=A0A1I3Q8W1_9PLAN|nr:putative sugar nucleotidyl transferase [Planctomicrobium piriforme]SFJ30110.1 UDP-N-acetylglucosamine diphosphorylase/glucosamine-1-phosphate N-acetyltransferase [Planctomicrobium piriforme]
MRRIVFFEDQTAAQFSPIALLRPVFELLCGHYSARERVCQSFSKTEWGAIVRGELAEAYRAEHPHAHINDAAWLSGSEFLLVNGRCLVEPAQLKKIKPGSAGWIGDTWAAILIDPAELPSEQRLPTGEDLQRILLQKKKVTLAGTVLNHPWDLISQNSKWLALDFAARSRPSAFSTADSRIAIIGPGDQVHIDATARLDPFVVIDATSGPVWVDRDVRIQAFTRIEGPAYVGPGTQLFRANVREGCSFGPVCRLGGEIEESIVHGYANKYHDGFLGHSYVCPWVNLGALSTNSDLKNDYSNVSVPLQGVKVPTGSTKVGAFIGDHAKTALCSLFNTGSAVGVMSLILPGGELLPKHIPSFSRVWHGRLDVLPDGCESGIQTARIAMSRRGQQLTPEMERLIRAVYVSTEGERRTAFERHRAAAH